MLVVGRRSVQATGSAREVTEAVDDRRQFVVQHAHEGLAAVLRLQRRIGFGVLLDMVGEPQQQQGALLRRGLAPGLEGARRRLHRPVDLFARGLAQLHQRVAVVRVEHGLLGALPGDEFPVDQQPGLHGPVLSVALVYFPLPATSWVSRVR
jgi:hypothetical protein